MTRLTLILGIAVLMLSNIIVFNLGVESGKEKMRQAYPTIRYQDDLIPFCWNFEVFKITRVDRERGVMKVKKGE